MTANEPAQKKIRKPKNGNKGTIVITRNEEQELKDAEETLKKKFSDDGIKVESKVKPPYNWSSFRHGKLAGVATALTAVFIGGLTVDIIDARKAVANENERLTAQHDAALAAAATEKNIAVREAERAAPSPYNAEREIVVKNGTRITFPAQMLDIPEIDAQSEVIKGGKVLALDIPGFVSWGTDLANMNGRTITYVDERLTQDTDAVAATVKEARRIFADPDYSKFDTIPKIGYAFVAVVDPTNNNIIGVEVKKDIGADGGPDVHNLGPQFTY